MTIRPNNTPSLAETPSIHRMGEFVDYAKRVSEIMQNMTVPERRKIIAMFHEAGVTIAEINTNPGVAMIVHGLLAQYNQTIRREIASIVANPAANDETLKLAA